MFFITIKSVNLVHFFLCQFKIKYVQILSDMGWIALTRYDNHTFLQIPTKNYLCRRFVMYSCDFRYNRVLQKNAIAFASAKRIPALNDDSLALDIRILPFCTARSIAL